MKNSFSKSQNRKEDKSTNPQMQEILKAVIAYSNIKFTSKK
jgi:hypothetical protein